MRKFRVSRSHNSLSIHKWIRSHFMLIYISITEHFSYRFSSFLWFFFPLWTERYINVYTFIQSHYTWYIWPSSKITHFMYVYIFHGIIWFIHYYYVINASLDLFLKAKEIKAKINVVVVQSLSRVQLFATPWAIACQAPLSFTVSWSLLRFMSIELVMLSNHLVLCHLPFSFCVQSFPSSGSFPMIPKY